MKARTKLVTMSSVVSARTGCSAVLALQPSERYICRDQIAGATGKQRTTSQAAYLEMASMEVERVLATTGELAWAKSCWNTTKKKGCSACGCLQ